VRSSCCGPWARAEAEQPVEDLGQRRPAVGREGRLDRFEAQLAVRAVHRFREPVRQNGEDVSRCHVHVRHGVALADFPGASTRVRVPLQKRATRSRSAAPTPHPRASGSVLPSTGAMIRSSPMSRSNWSG
jgi:hypothetical protein